jgi:hypothetical protein
MAGGLRALYRKGVRRTVMLAAANYAHVNLKPAFLKLLERHSIRTLQDTENFISHSALIEIRTAWRSGHGRVPQCRC